MQSNETKQLIERMFRFNKLMHNEMSSTTECSPGECRMLTVIANEQEKNEKEGNGLPGVTVSKISDQLMHSKPATSRMLNVMEEKGIITRISSNKDRRTVYIALTEQGKKHAKQLRNHYDEKTNQIFERLGEEKSSQLFQIMDDIYEIVKEMKAEAAEKKKKEK